MLSLDKNKFGNSEIYISKLGFGAGEIGDFNISDNDAEKILTKAFDLGINFFDTARGYFASEDRIGRFLSSKRKDIVLSTKIGYGIAGIQDWTYDSIIAGVDEALKKLKTDYLDIVHLHSCDKGILEQGDVINALLKTVEAGKVLVPAYSGENDSLKYAVECGAFKSIQSSINITDQFSLRNIIPEAKRKGMGVIAKRPIANAPWKYPTKPIGSYVEEYWSRWQKLAIATDITPAELFIRFSVFAEGVSTAITGTTNLEHLKTNISYVNKGPLPADVLSEIKNKYDSVSDNWPGEI